MGKAAHLTQVGSIQSQEFLKADLSRLWSESYNVAGQGMQSPLEAGKSGENKLL